MLPPLIQRPRRRAVRRPRERGVTLALVALAIFSIIAMAGLSIDVGTLYQASAEAQRAADAAALAGARAISISGITGAATPSNQTATWQQICGGSSSIATEIAISVAQQNFIGGAAPSSTTVTYSASTGAVSPGKSDCSTLGAAFGVNPVVTVKVTQTSLATYFARIWGRTGSSVSATASAEVFNPSNSGTYAGGMVPVQPRCVKPWIVPNYDPIHPPGVTPPPSYCSTGGNPPCSQLVSTADGSIQSPGIFANGPLGVIGERFWLVPDCGVTAPCSLLDPLPQANSTSIAQKPSLEYLPGQANFASTAVPSDGSDACTNVASAVGYYAQAIAGCDQSTQYQCGKPGQNVVDLSENPGMGDTTNGVECLIHETTANSLSGQDSLAPFVSNISLSPNYPFQIQAGDSSPLLTSTSGVKPNDFITSSTSIVSLPIYDTATTINNTGGTTAVTIVGFLQVFIYSVDLTGKMQVAVLNVSGCGNAAPGTALTGTSPVPVRLITPP